MLHQHRRFHIHGAQPNLFNSTLRHKSWKAAALFAALLLMGAIMLVAGPKVAALVVTPREANPGISVDKNYKLPDLNSIEAKGQLVPFYAQDQYLANHSNPAYWDSAPPLSRDQVRALLNAVAEDQADDKRVAATTILKQLPSAIVPTLIDALADSDSNVRYGATQILGLRRAPEANDPLFFATFDADPQVRAAAAWGLGELSAMQAVPRLERLQVSDADVNVRQSARLAEEKIYAQVAASLGVPANDVRALAIAPANGRVYAATGRDLYGPHGLSWARLSRLPDEATALTTADDGTIIYLGTASAGPFRSRDGGLSWQSIKTGLPTETAFMITAMLVHPDNSQQVYMTLGVDRGTARLPLTPFGIFHTTNSGNSWSPLVQWQVDLPTIRLVVDPTRPEYLYGLTESGAWEYPLVKHPCDQTETPGDADTNAPNC